MVRLSAVVLLPFSIFTTVIPLHLGSSGLSVESLPMDLGHELNEQSVFFNVNKTLFTLYACMLKMAWFHICRIILHFTYYKNREIYYSAAGTAILECKRLQLLLCYTYNPW